MAARRRDLVELADCYAENAVPRAPQGQIRSRDDIVASWGRCSRHSPISPSMSRRSWTAIGWRYLTRDTSDLPAWFGRAPLGVPISYRLVLLFTISGNRVVHDQRIYDSAGLLERLEKARIDKELRTAAEVQRALQSRTACAGPFYESVGDSVSCRAIGGDFFDFIDLPTGDLALVMGDVAGKGPAAALLAAMIQGILEGDARAESPATVLARVNQRLITRDFGSRFATLVYAVLSPDGRLAYANAGHNPPALIPAISPEARRLQPSDVQRLTSGGPILGVFGSASFDEAVLHVRPGDVLVMFTDGVTEARNADDEEFGERRLLACLVEHRGADPGRLLNQIFTEVRTFCGREEQSDDITAAVTRFR